MCDAYFDIVVVDASGAEKRRDKAVGATPRLSADRVRSTVADGSSISFSALGARFFRGLMAFSLL